MSEKVDKVERTINGNGRAGMVAELAALKQKVIDHVTDQGLHTKEK